MIKRIAGFFLMLLPLAAVTAWAGYSTGGWGAAIVGGLAVYGVIGSMALGAWLLFS